MAAVEPKELEYVQDDGKNKSKRGSLVENHFVKKFISQTIILTKKNFITQRRFKKITAGQFCVGLLLILILIVFSELLYQTIRSLKVCCKYIATRTGTFAISMPIKIRFKWKML